MVFAFCQVAVVSLFCYSKTTSKTMMGISYSSHEGHEELERNWAFEQQIKFASSILFIHSSRKNVLCKCSTVNNPLRTKNENWDPRVIWDQKQVISLLRFSWNRDWIRWRLSWKKSWESRAKSTRHDDVISVHLNFFNNRIRIESIALRLMCESSQGVCTNESYFGILIWVPIN